MHLLRSDVNQVRHVGGRKERKADEEIKGGHLANELERSLRVRDWEQYSLKELPEWQQVKEEKNTEK